MVTKFKNHLAKTNLAKNTVTSYVWTVNYFLTHYKEVNKKNLLAYKRLLGGELQTTNGKTCGCKASTSIWSLQSRTN